MFNNENLFAMALSIEEPLFVEKIEFDKEIGELHIYIDFRKGSRFKCSVCRVDGMPVHDTMEKTWRHLNFFQYKAFLHYRTPRTNCPEHGVHLVDVPWGGGKGFTLLFEAMIMQMAKSMTVSDMSKLVDEHDTRIWRIINRHVSIAHSIVDYSDVRHIGLDETSSKKGHNYVTVFVDMDESKVIHVTEGRDSGTIKDFKNVLPYHNGNATQIEEISADMSPAFKKGIYENFPWAVLTFDKFHVIKLINEAVDQVRREEQKSCPILKHTRYLWLKNKSNLGAKKQEMVDALSKLNLKTVRAYHLKISIQEIYETATDEIEATNLLQKWYSWATRSRLEAMKKVAKTIKNNWNGIINYFKTRTTNATLEGINSKIQIVRARARGYRNINNFISMIYLIAGKLSFNFRI